MPLAPEDYEYFNNMVNNMSQSPGFTKFAQKIIDRFKLTEPPEAVLPFLVACSLEVSSSIHTATMDKLMVLEGEELQAALQSFDAVATEWCIASAIASERIGIHRIAEADEAAKRDEIIDLTEQEN